MPLTNTSDAPALKSSDAIRHRSRRIAVRRSTVHGRGVFATRALAPGELVCEYLGERIPWDEALRRHPRDPAHPDHTFYFDIGGGTVIDGAVGGNSARWINHACRPNCEAEDHNGRYS
ncbi:SET domain-containing protein [Paraburkholderia sp. BL21I4N1]|uniref:SET domain-containing protein n=1 Tax=Paraburkholderia sp. BL21I4N1 TaxID=1938801 RepID=UPI00280AD7C4|nr:SET domain-containing protein [Paraburkholderia sp. BL21I4N1]